jgi:hypothetical protein
MQPSYPEFRRRLDAVLRQRDPAALRAFLVAEGQWEENTPTNPERAMWMMIATSAALAPMHDEAIQWLEQQGYREEAAALGTKRVHANSTQAQRPTQPRQSGRQPYSKSHRPPSSPRQER